MSQIVLMDIGTARQIKTLWKDDWADWKHIRLEALKLHPEAFGSSYDDEVENTDETFQQSLVKNTMFGAFNDHNLIGVAGFFVFPRLKMQHRGNLFSMYLKKEYRGQGIGGQLLEAIIREAKSKVIQLHCTVVTSNASALTLYQKHGFRIYGTEPRSLKVGAIYHDEYLMVLNFDA